MPDVTAAERIAGRYALLRPAERALVERDIQRAIDDAREEKALLRSPTTW